MKLRIKDAARPLRWIHGPDLRRCRYGHLVSAVELWPGTTQTVCGVSLGTRRGHAVSYTDPNFLPDVLSLCPACVDLAPDDA